MEHSYTGKYKQMAEEFRKDGCDKYTIEKFNIKCLDMISKQYYKIIEKK